MIFEGEFTHPKKVFQLAIDQLDFYLQVLQDVKCKASVKPPSANKRCRMPPMGTMKLNWDAVIDHSQLWSAVVLMGQLGFMDVILEGDCLEVVKSLTKEERNETRYGFILEKTK